MQSEVALYILKLYEVTEQCQGKLEKVKKIVE